MTIELRTGRTAHGRERDEPERLYGCWRCGKSKPRRAFDLGPKGRQLSRVCRDCRAVEAEQRAARRTTRKLANGTIAKRCSNCRRWRQRARFFAVCRWWPDGRPRYWNSWCNACIAERHRMNYRLRAEAEGRPVKTYRGGARHSPYVVNQGSCGLPIPPLQAWLEAVIEREAPELGRPSTGSHTGLEALADREGVTVEGLAAQLGVDSRALWRVRHAEHPTISLGTADRLLTNYGRPVVIRSRDLERRLVDWAQSLPGNGTRLLAYMDRAEAVGHLADVPILFLADLWPELDE